MTPDRLVVPVQLLTLTIGSAVFQFDSSASERAQTGKAQLESLLRANTGSHSCHAAAVQGLTDGCRDMGPEQQSRLAVQASGPSALARARCSHAILTLVRMSDS